jgi:hypothetical protein
MLNGALRVSDARPDASAAVCPDWCLRDHDAETEHRGTLHAIEVRGRRRMEGPDRIEPADERERLSAQLVRYSDDPTDWIAVRTRTGVPIEVAIDDANRWVILLGSAMVDAQD